MFSYIKNHENWREIEEKSWNVWFFYIKWVLLRFTVWTIMSQKRLKRNNNIIHYAITSYTHFSLRTLNNLQIGFLDCQFSFVIQKYDVALTSRVVRLNLQTKNHMPHNLDNAISKYENAGNTLRQLWCKKTDSDFL